MEKFLESTGKLWPKSFKKETIVTMVLTGLNLPLEMEGDLVILFFTTEKDRWGRVTPWYSPIRVSRRFESLSSSFPTTF
jgi:hypothetical protein